MHRLVPPFILENYQAENYRGSFDAVGLLVDVTGFSSMTDVLAQHGPHGSEVLANGMRRVFDPMIQRVMEYGGYVVGFAGDAITALFPIVGSTKEAYSNALASALSIQEYRTNHAGFETPYGKFNISVKVGLGDGQARWKIVVATDRKRATYCFFGSAVDNAVNSLSLAKSGEIILSPNLHQALSEDSHGTYKGECFLLTGFSGKLPERREIDVPTPDPDHLRVFCSDEVSAHDLAGEFRPAVNLFIGLPSAVDQEMQLEVFLQKVFSLQNIYGGLFSRVDIGDKGTNLLMFWGAPLAQENDVERALNFFLELRKETRDSIIAGITYRLAYAGYMGSRLQEEYTCYGWGVSFSARLMTSAGPGEIWADEEIARRAGRRFNFQAVGKRIFKGFSKEQNVFKLLERKQDEQGAFSGAFVGRESELAALGRFINPIWSGQFAGILTITGEPGIGKSRLIDAFQASHLFVENKATWAICQADEIVRQSLNPFRYWLKRYFHIPETMDDLESKQTFDEKLDEVTGWIPDNELSQSLNRTRSFLGELLDLHWPDSLYEKLDAQGRYDNTFIALSSLVRAEGLRQPLIIVLEDSHLLDSDTKAFLLYLERVLTADAERAYPIAILATSRETGSRILLEHAPNEEIFIRALADSDLVRLAETLLAGAVAPPLLRTLEQRAEGNPFFIEQIIRYLQDGQQLELGRAGWQIADREALESLPTDISAILISRLDRLNREVREVVQTASILGREFELRLLSQMLHEDKALPEKVQHAVQADILSILTEIRYIFRHALFRDAAYNMQLRARQQELHRIAVEAFEVLYQDQLSAHYSEIAYHADRAGLREKAKKFYILAGAEAARAYKNSLAIESYTRALALSSIENIQERIDLLLARVALYRIIADRAGQEQDLATLEFLAEKQKNKRNRAIVASRQAGLAFDLGDFLEAQQLAETAIEIAKSAKALDVTAQVYSTLPLTLSRQGLVKQAIEAAQTGIRLTQQIGDRPGEGQLYNDLGLILLEQKEHNRAREYFEKSLSIAQESGNRRIEAQVLNNLGNISGMFANDYIAARKYFEQALEIVREIGNRTGEGYALGNIGWTASIAGDFEMARHCLMGRLTIARESGNRYLEAFGLINLGAMMVTQEDYADALEYIEQSLVLVRKFKDRSIEAWALTFLGFANVGLSNLNDAKDQFQTAYDIRLSLNQNELAMEPLAGLAQVDMERNDPAGALVYVQEIMSHLKKGGSLEGTEEPLRIYLIIYQALTANHDLRADLVLEEAYSVLKKHLSSIQDETNQEMFIQNVPWRRRIHDLWMQKQTNR